MPKFELPSNEREKRDLVYKIIDAILEQPELKEAMKKGNFLWQNKFHEYDVYDHSADFLKHIKELTSDPNMIAAAYLHDIGKPMVAQPKIDKKTNVPVYKNNDQALPYHEFTDHEKVGAKYIRELNPEVFNKINQALNPVNIQIDQETVAQLVNSHYLPMRGIKGIREIIKTGGTYEEWLEAFKKLNEYLNKPAEAPDISKEQILTMFLADKLAQGPNLPDKEELMAIRDLMAKNNFSPVELKKIYELQQANFKNKVWDY